MPNGKGKAIQTKQNDAAVEPQSSATEVVSKSGRHPSYLGKSSGHPAEISTSINQGQHQCSSKKLERATLAPRPLSSRATGKATRSRSHGISDPAPRLPIHTTRSWRPHGWGVAATLPLPQPTPPERPEPRTSQHLDEHRTHIITDTPMWNYV